MWTIDSNGNYMEVNGEHFIKLNPKVNSIRFTAKYNGFIYAYVVGDFNNWEKKREYLLDCIVDPNDGTIKFSKDIVFKNNLKPGVYNYSYVLVDIEGNEFFLKDKDGKPQPSFTWNGLGNHIDIKSSSDLLYIGQEIELVAVKTRKQGKLDLLNVKWSLNIDNDSLKLDGNKLILLKEIKGISEIEVTAYHKETTLKGKKVIKIINENRAGTLVHFIKSDNCYLDNGFCWDLWCFDIKRGDKSTDFTENSDFGAAAFVEHDNVIARRRAWGDNWSNDWSDQTMAFTINKHMKNVYIVYGDNILYSDLNKVIEATKPRIEVAIMDSRNKITAYLSHEPVGTDFEIFINGVLKKDVNILVKGEKRKVIFTNLPLDILSSDLIEVRATNTFIPCKVTMRGFLDDFYYEPWDIGVNFSNNDILLRLWAPTAKQVELLVYNSWDIENNLPSKVYPMNHDHSSGTYFTKINRDINTKKYYLYRLHFNEIDRNGKRYVKTTYAVDPYAVAVSINGDKGYLLDITDKETMPKEWLNGEKPQLINKKDSIIYEMHIRDFTIDENSGVSKSLRGKYLGAVEKGSTYKDKEKNLEVKTGLDHLIELGITHVHLMPIFDFATVDERYPELEGNRNWGYDPKNYNVPEGSYSLNPQNPISRILELREMVKGFHEAGIRVVMDMVYNHMYDTRNYDNIVPGYYFRTNKYGKFTNGSGCGNELATERPMVSKFIIDSILHWVINYKIDGLRFDLMELMDFDTMKNIVKKVHEIDDKIIIYGEPWRGGETPLENGVYKGRQRNEKFSIFNDTFRDAIRGNNGLSKGFINGGQHNKEIAWTVVEGLKGSVNSLTANPLESINYIDAHDNYTLWDQIEKSNNIGIKDSEYRQNIYKDIIDDYLVRKYILGLSIVLTAQGIPFLHGGVEFLRTKNGDHNSYRGTDKINALKWKDKIEFYDVFKYIKNLISMRKQHPAFRMLSKEDILNNLDINFVNNDDNSGVIISKIKGNVDGEVWNNIIIIYNGTDIDNYDVNNIIPDSEIGSWRIVATEREIDLVHENYVKNGELPALKSRSIMIICN